MLQHKPLSRKTNNKKTNPPQAEECGRTEVEIQTIVWEICFWKGAREKENVCWEKYGEGRGVVPWAGSEYNTPTGNRDYSSSYYIYIYNFKIISMFLSNSFVRMSCPCCAWFEIQFIFLVHCLQFRLSTCLIVSKIQNNTKQLTTLYYTVLYCCVLFWLMHIQLYQCPLLLGCACDKIRSCWVAARRIIKRHRGKGKKAARAERADFSSRSTLSLRDMPNWNWKDKNNKVLYISVLCFLQVIPPGIFFFPRHICPTFSISGIASDIILWHIFWHFISYLLATYSFSLAGILSGKFLTCYLDLRVSGIYSDHIRWQLAIGKLDRQNTAPGACGWGPEKET